MKLLKFVKSMKKGMKGMKLGATAVRRFALFNAVGALGIGVQLTVLWVLVDLWGVVYPLATALAVAAAVVHNFAWHRRWTWSDRRTDGAAATLAFARFLGTNGVISIVGNVGLMFLLIEIGGANALIANAIAIATCGVVNFAVSDQFVFQA
jgi:putative flippase GtrA